MDNQKPRCALCGRWFYVGEKYWFDSRMKDYYCRKCFKKINDLRKGIKNG